MNDLNAEKVVVNNLSMARRSQVNMLLRKRIEFATEINKSSVFNLPVVKYCLFELNLSRRTYFFLPWQTGSKLQVL